MNARVRVDNRLIYLRGKEEEGNLWDNHWSTETIKRTLNLDKKLAISEYEEVFGKYLEKDMFIVEAGCGPCQILNALIQREYNCIGIDYSIVLLNKVKKLREEFRLARMDVGAMAIGDSTCDAYISLGVMEHFPEGMQRPLSEAKRVLRSGGIIILQVPHFNPLRKLFGQWGIIRRVHESDVEWQNFYQYAFMPQEVRALLSENDFELLGERYFRVMKGLKDEIVPIKKTYSFYKKMTGRNLALKIIAKPLGYLLKALEFLAHRKSVRNQVSHMMMFIAKKR